LLFDKGLETALQGILFDRQKTAMAPSDVIFNA
jgi:hypothetical protein